MRILVCGGNGFIGRHIVNLLALAGHDPVARSRHSLPALDYAKATTPDAWLPHLAGVDAVVNAVGVLRDSASRPIDAMHAQAPIALFDACAAAGVRRVVQISALGIEGSATRYATTKRAADEHLLALTAAGHLQGCVVRPSVVFGAGGASSEMFLSMARLPALLLPRPVLQARVQPVAVRDLAEAVAGLVTSPEPVGMIEIGGPLPLPLAALIASLRAQMGRAPARVGTLPGWLTRASARAGDWVSASPWCSETLAMLASDNVTDPAGLQALLGRPGIAPAQLLATLRHG
ncbi:NAD-dependent epimerase/dehydratase family protein [Delftia sp. RIT313]|uniref:NAD-dependent epimerase/dehydratase family protein n=1 Tax=Delftia sp. RIT313 TaxID=1468410 RepID=UPI00044D3DD8|nr:NAD-dependent epimerase/dehydratase family protein [Delftia sp. RIT313]EZP57063.1 NAD-dependent epimerase/dehydratase [Delftia sp. RIT313]